ncbi:hypothetical protein K491DRAFT_695875 [Lophiostoma macrostomum CBS 122681]|uniref:Uncharacterized protein n=1 Tax=Lophiostoma macrostomum CBS 122681 TaxID=1314788 RepID=A0A6A6T031_9PLEO|nr:hypothetical protein K491DRAFT_695875 [Lophiostoma macrostomum CBS 122681]
MSNQRRQAHGAQNTSSSGSGQSLQAPSQASSSSWVLPAAPAGQYGPTVRAPGKAHDTVVGTNQESLSDLVHGVPSPSPHGNFDENFSHTYDDGGREFSQAMAMGSFPIDNFPDTYRYDASGEQYGSGFVTRTNQYGASGGPRGFTSTNQYSAPSEQHGSDFITSTNEYSASREPRRQTVFDPSLSPNSMTITTPSFASPYTLEPDPENRSIHTTTNVTADSGHLPQSLASPAAPVDHRRRAMPSSSPSTSTNQTRAKKRRTDSTTTSVSAEEQPQGPVRALGVPPYLFPSTAQLQSSAPSSSLGPTRPKKVPVRARTACSTCHRLKIKVSRETPETANSMRRCADGKRAVRDRWWRELREVLEVQYYVQGAGQVCLLQWGVSSVINLWVS